MSISTLNELFLEELKDVYDAEHQLVDTLPGLAEAATNLELRSAFENHLAETQGHLARLEAVFSFLGEKPDRNTCKGMQGLISEGKKLMKSWRVYGTYHQEWQQSIGQPGVRQQGDPEHRGVVGRPDQGRHTRRVRIEEHSLGILDEWPGPLAGPEPAPHQRARERGGCNEESPGRGGAEEAEEHERRERSG